VNDKVVSTAATEIHNVLAQRKRWLWGISLLTAVLREFRSHLHRIGGPK